MDKEEEAAKVGTKMARSEVQVTVIGYGRPLRGGDIEAFLEATSA